jgi:hypothetical protein
MTVFCIFKVDDGYTLKHYPLVEQRLDPSAAETKQSGVTTSPIDGVSVLVVTHEIFQVFEYLIISAGTTLHLFC